MAQDVSRRPLTAEAQVRSQVSPCGICGGQSGTGTGLSPSTSVSPVNFIPPVLHYTEKRKKNIITGLHNKHRGCGASVASAAGPFTIKKSGFRAPVHNVLPDLQHNISLPSLWTPDNGKSENFVDKADSHCLTEHFIAHMRRELLGRL
jgi:hypothetical protein